MRTYEVEIETYGSDGEGCYSYSYSYSDASTITTVTVEARTAGRARRYVKRHFEFTPGEQEIIRAARPIEA